MAPYSYSPITDEKCPVDVASAENQVRSTPSIRGKLRSFLPAVLLLSALLLLLVRSTFICHGTHDPASELGMLLRSAQDIMETGKVTLEAHIMSKCPDARDCLQQLVVPTMERVSDKVDFKLSYIGR